MKWLKNTQKSLVRDEALIKNERKGLTHECVSTLEPFGDLVFPDKFAVKLLLYTLLNPPQS